MTDRSKWGLLVTLALVWLTVLGFRVMNQPEPQRVPLKFKSGPAQPRPKSDLPPVVWPAQARVAEVSFKTPKNIFAPPETLTEPERQKLAAVRKRAKGAASPVVPPPPPVPPPPTPEELAAQEARRQQELARQQQELAAQQARQLMSQYRFLGYLTQGGESKAFLGKGKDIFVVRPGETVDGRIQITAIDPTSVKLKETSTSLETTIPLTKSADPS
jgi:hypothetical protein